MISPVIEAAAAEYLRAIPEEFARYSLPTWRLYGWQKWVLRKVGPLLLRGGARIMVNAPPRFGKSVVFSRILPIWFLDNWPGQRVMITSYASELAVEFGRSNRNEFATNELLRTKLRQDSKSASRWNTRTGEGGMFCAGLDGAITGRGFNFGLVDDPYKSWEEAQSATVRSHSTDWFRSTFLPRAEPGASIVINSTRWHRADLCGHLMETEGDTWTQIVLPAVAEDNDPMGRKRGQILCPERFPTADDLERLMRVGEDAWESQYQQRPKLSGAGAVYRGFSDRNKAAVQLVPGLPVCVAFDWNINPGMYCCFGQYDPKADAFFVVDELFSPGKSVEEHMPGVLAWLQANAPQAGKTSMGVEIQIFGDATGTGRSIQVGRSSFRIAENAILSKYRRVRRRVPRANPPASGRVATVNDALRDMSGRSHVTIHPRCQVLLRDLANVTAASDGTIDKSNPMLTHSSDAFGYWVHYVRPLRRQEQRSSAKREASR